MGFSEIAARDCRKSAGSCGNRDLPTQSNSKGHGFLTAEGVRSGDKGRTRVGLRARKTGPTLTRKFSPRVGPPLWLAQGNGSREGRERTEEKTASATFGTLPYFAPRASQGQSMALRSVAKKNREKPSDPDVCGQRAIVASREAPTEPGLQPALRRSRLRPRPSCLRIAARACWPNPGPGKRPADRIPTPGP